VRLDKLLAHAGYGTRKEVKELVRKRYVTVDDKVVTKSNMHVEPNEQIIKVDDETVFYQKYMYIMLHKPPDYLSATEDRHQPTVIDLLPEKYKHFQVAPVGRLDKDTEGLLLLTNDGQLNHILTSPKRDIFKTYFVKVKGNVTEEYVEKFHQGIVLDDGYKTKKAYLEIINSNDISEVELSISEGKFHQVKRMFRAIGMEVIYLKRISIGDLQLDPDLPIGDCRLLTEEELEYLLSFKK